VFPFQLFEDALDEAPPEKPKKSRSSTKVGRKLSKFRMKDKSAKNGNGDNGEANQVRPKASFVIFHKNMQDKKCKFCKATCILGFYLGHFKQNKNLRVLAETLSVKPIEYVFGLNAGVGINKG
jgi:hypothetical protein